MENSATFFKLVIYFKLKPDGNPFTDQEVKEGKNKKYCGSFDWHKTRFKERMYNAELSLSKMEKLINTTYLNRFKTAFIVCNDYKGYEIVIRKYVDSVIRFGMGINYIKPELGKEDTVIYSIPAADELIRGYVYNTLDKAQKTLIKPICKNIPAALPYYTRSKISDNFLHLRA